MASPCRRRIPPDGRERGAARRTCQKLLSPGDHMAAWLPLIKAALPYVTQIVPAAFPTFTSKPAANRSDDVIAKQISELQNAATHNAESIKGLAQQLKQTSERSDAAARHRQYA